MTKVKREIATTPERRFAMTFFYPSPPAEENRDTGLPGQGRAMTWLSESEGSRYNEQNI
jgi:hypothetical protein